MDNRVQEVMENMSKNLGKDLEAIEPTANMKLHMTLENCYNKSGDNADRFASCMQNSQKKISDIMESFQLKMLFLSRNAQKCIQDGNDVGKCSDNVTAMSKSVIQNLLKDIEKV